MPPSHLEAEGFCSTPPTSCCGASQQVGIVRQTESAALKAAGSNKSGPFVRSLAALHTPATLDAGDVENGGLDSTDKAAASADQDDARGSSNCLLAVVEQVL